MALFDRIIHQLDPAAYKEALPHHYLMTLVSVYGLGFQLLALGLALVWLPLNYILPGIVLLTTLLPLIIAIRRTHALGA